MKKYTLGILDEEDTEIEIIEACFESDFNISKINTVSSIEELIEIIKNERIDVISIDYKLRDHNSDIPYNGDYFFNELLEKFGDFPAFVLTQDVNNARNHSKKINPRFIVDKKDIHTYVSGQKEDAKKKFIEDLQFEIEVHRNKIEDDSQELKYLQEKIDTGQDITGEEQNRYIELNNRLSKSISGTSHIPVTYFSQETNKRLDTLIEKTEKLLDKLEKEND